MIRPLQALRPHPSHPVARKDTEAQLGEQEPKVTHPGLALTEEDQTSQPSSPSLIVAIIIAIPAAVNN